MNTLTTTSIVCSMTMITTTLCIYYYYTHTKRPSSPSPSDGYIDTSLMRKNISNYQSFMDSVLTYIQSIYLNAKNSNTPSSCLSDSESKSRSKSKRIIQYCNRSNGGSDTSTPPPPPIEQNINVNKSLILDDGVRDRVDCLSSDEMHYQNVSCEEAKNLRERGYPGLCNVMIGQRRCINECMSGCGGGETKDTLTFPDPDTCKKDGVFDVTYYLGRYDELDRAFRYNHSEATNHWETIGRQSDLVGCEGCCPGTGRT